MVRSRFGSALMLAFIATIFIGAYASAAIVTVSSLSNDSPSSVGYDPDKPAPTVTADGFHANGTANGGTNGDYNSIRFTPDAIGMSGLKLGEITAASYDAINAIAGTSDWRFKVYTSGGASWYLTRVEAPTTISGNTLTHHNLTSYDRVTVKGGGDYYSNDSQFYPTITAAANQPVLFFDISAGAASGGYAYDTTLNNISITANGYGTSTITAAVPEPTSLAAIGIGSLGLLRRRR